MVISDQRIGDDHLDAGLVSRFCTHLVMANLDDFSTGISLRRYAIFVAAVGEVIAPGIYSTFVRAAVYLAATHRDLRRVFSCRYRGAAILENFYWLYTAILAGTFYCGYFVNQSV